MMAGSARGRHGCIQGVLNSHLLGDPGAVGLSKLGGFDGLHAPCLAHVPAVRFRSLSEYAWTRCSRWCGDLVSIVGWSRHADGGMATTSSRPASGDRRHVHEARLMLFWALAGLIAIGLYAGQLHDRISSGAS